jgi:hypothetical protein
LGRSGLKARTYQPGPAELSQTLEPACHHLLQVQTDLLGLKSYPDESL